VVLSCDYTTFENEVLQLFQSDESTTEFCSMALFVFLTLSHHMCPKECHVSIMEKKRAFSFWERKHSYIAFLRKKGCTEVLHINHH